MLAPGIFNAPAAAMAGPRSVRQRLIHAHRPELRPAVRASLGLAIPGAVLLFLGRAELMVYVAFGSVVVMYGRSPYRKQRFIDQLLAAAMMLGASLAGIIVAPWQLHGWTLLAGGIVVASASSLIADRRILQPGGAFFPLFAFGTLATLPVGQSLSTAGLITFAATTGFSILVGQAASFEKAPHRLPPRAPISWRQPLSRAACYACVLLLAGTVAIAWDFEHLQWVMAGAVVPLAAGTARGRLSRGLHRMAGTIAGVLVLWVIFQLQQPPLWLGVAIIALMFPTAAYMMRNYGLALSFFTPLLMLMLALADPRLNEDVLVERAAANVLGVVVGIVAAFAFDPRRSCIAPAAPNA